MIRLIATTVREGFVCVFFAPSPMTRFTRKGSANIGAYVSRVELLGQRGSVRSVGAARLRFRTIRPSTRFTRACLRDTIPTAGLFGRETPWIEKTPRVGRFSCWFFFFENSQKSVYLDAPRNHRAADDTRAGRTDRRRFDARAPRFARPDDKSTRAGPTSVPDARYSD